MNSDKYHAVMAQSRGSDCEDFINKWKSYVTDMADFGSRYQLREVVIRTASIIQKGTPCMGGCWSILEAMKRLGLHFQPHENIQKTQ